MVISLVPVTPPSAITGMYLPVSAKYLSRSSVTSITVVANPLPVPFCSCVIQIEPPPIPTFTAFAPASTRKRKPSLVIIFPPITGVFGNSFTIHLTASAWYCVCPSEESIAITSTFALTKAFTRSL